MASTEDSMAEVLELVQQLLSAGLSEFREIHYMCKESELFTCGTISKIDECAANFRQLGLVTVQLVNCTSNVFLEKIIFFHDNIWSFQQDEMQDQLSILGEEAKELSQAFQMIAKWYNKLAGNLQDACQETRKEAESFVPLFKSKALEARRLALDDRKKWEKARADHSSALDSKVSWGIATVLTSWTGLGLIIGSVGLLVAKAKVSSASSAEKIAAREVSKSAKMFAEARNSEKKAEIIADKSGKLVGILEETENASDILATFWTDESNTFGSQGRVMKTAKFPISYMRKFMSKKLEEMKNTKPRYDSYVDNMSFIINLYNFKTDVKPVTRTYTIQSLDLDLTIPSSLFDI